MTAQEDVSMPQPKPAPANWGSLSSPMPLSVEQIEARARELLARMTLEEKIGQMSGDTPIFPAIVQMAWAYNTRPMPAGENRRLGLPAIQFTDGPRGVVVRLRLNAPCLYHREQWLRVE